MEQIVAQIITVPTIISDHPYFVVDGEIWDRSGKIELAPNGRRMVTIAVRCVKDDSWNGFSESTRARRSRNLYHFDPGHRG